MATRKSATGKSVKVVKKAAKKKTVAKRVVSARRQARLHDDGSISNAVRQIESVFDLPKGSVRLEYPSGRKARSDSNVGNVREAWKKK